MEELSTVQKQAYIVKLDRNQATNGNFLDNFSDCFIRCPQTINLRIQYFRSSFISLNMVMVIFLKRWRAEFVAHLFEMEMKIVIFLKGIVELTINEYCQ
jgi:hypothetical protein